MKVFVVMKDQVDWQELICVFSQREEAIEFINKQEMADSYWYEEQEVL